MNKPVVLGTLVALISLFVVLLTVTDVSPWLRLAGVVVAVLLALKLIVAARGGRPDVGHLESSVRRWTRVDSSST